MNCNRWAPVKSGHLKRLSKNRRESMTPAYLVSILLDCFLCVLFTACLPEDEECSNAD